MNTRQMVPFPGGCLDCHLTFGTQGVLQTDGYQGVSKQWSLEAHANTRCCHTGSSGASSTSCGSCCYVGAGGGLVKCENCSATTGRTVGGAIHGPLDLLGVIFGFS